MTSIGNPHITLGKQESLFQFLHLKKQGCKKLREWPSSGSNLELLSSCSSVVNCCATMRNQTQCQILSPNKSVQTEVLWLRLAGSFSPWRLWLLLPAAVPKGRLSDYYTHLQPLVFAINCTTAFVLSSVQVIPLSLYLPELSELEEGTVPW